MKHNIFDDMSYEERLRYFCTGPVRVKRITVVDPEDLVEYFSPAIHGYIISPPNRGPYRFLEYDRALENGRKVLAKWRAELEKIELANKPEVKHDR